MPIKPIFNESAQLTLALLGPTAIGKTALAIELARQFPNIRLISVDSAMVYRGLDIGSGKPDQATLSEVPHALVDIRDPWEPYSAADFCREATQLIQATHAEGRIPFLVGGTFLYFKTLVSGLSNLPPAQPVIRQQIEECATKLGWPAMHELLAKVDAEAAERIKPLDRQRITRALEVFEVTGKPLSAWFADSLASPEGQGVLSNLKSFSLVPANRTELHERIATRFHHMMDQGFLAEVESLLANPKIMLDLPSMKSVGYRQLSEYVVFRDESFSEKAIAATRQLAKRQLTWLRSMPDIPTFTNTEACFKAISNILA